MEDSIFPSARNSLPNKSSLFPVNLNAAGVGRNEQGVGGFSFAFSGDVSGNQIPSSALPPNIEDEFSSDEDQCRSSKRKDRKTERPRREKRRRKERSASHDRKAAPKAQKAPTKKVEASTASYLSNNPKHVFLKDAGVSPKEAFCVNTKPDSHNFAFDETYWKNVPKFRKPPRLVLGESSRGKWKRKPEPRYFQFAKELLFMRNNPGLQVKPSDDVVPFGRNYLPLTEVEEVIDIDDDVVETEESALTRARTRFYNSRLSKHPTNVSLWLEFIRFQDEAAKINFGTSVLKNSSGILQRKIAILERAMEHNPSNLELRLRRLVMCEDTWEKDQLTNEWRKLVNKTVAIGKIKPKAFDHPNNPYVWNSYLFFLKSYFPSFLVSRVAKAYQKYVSISLSISSGQFQSHPARPFHLEHMVVHAFLMTQFWIDAGHQEKAMSFQQALLELNLNFPDCYNNGTPLKECLIFLEQFWDSGLARVGEKGAIGWERTKQEKTHPEENGLPSVDLDEKENALVQESTSATALWSKLESLRTSQFLLPFHGTDEPSDPERIVLFDDISTVLSRCDSTSNMDIKFLMVTCLLSSLHCWMPRMFSMKSYAGKTFLGSALNNPLGALFSNWSESHCRLGSTDNCSRMVFEPFQQTWSESQAIIDRIIELTIDKFSGVHRTYLSVAWLQNKLTKCVEKGAPKSAAKDCRSLAKTLLKKPENRSNLVIWEWYAFCESVLETSEAAGMDVLEKVLGSTKSDPQNPEQLWMAARLVRFHVESTLGILSGIRTADKSVERKKCLRSLIQFAEGSEMTMSDTTDVPPSRILKCRKSFEHLLELELDFSSRVYAFGSAVSNVGVCFGLFEYLTSGFDAAVAVYESRIAFCRTRVSAMDNVDFTPELEMLSMDCEILTEALVRLAHYHQRNSQLSSSAFRGILMSALKDFPTNSLILGQFIQSEMAVFVSGRLREYFEEALKDTDSAVPWLFAIFAEYERKYRLLKNWTAACTHKIVQEVSLATFKDTGITHKLRSLFERAVESESVKHCPLIWQMYLKFEMDSEDLPKAEGVYFRAIQSCPWSKDVYLAAIRYFPHRTQEIIDVMIEKELRVFTPYEEAELLMSTKSDQTVANVTSL